MILLIEYDRRAGRLIKYDRFEDSQRKEAQAERLRRELALKGDPYYEVVLLDAQDLSDIQSTHRRYFEGDLERMTLNQFIEGAQESLAAFMSAARQEHLEDPKEFPLTRDELDWWREVVAFVALKRLESRMLQRMERAKAISRSEMD